MVRRIIDVLLSLLFILLFLPLCILIAVAIKFEDGKKVLYTSQRVGLGGRMFGMFKFRTMISDQHNLSNEQLFEFRSNFKLTNDNRITNVGHWLRKYGFDEIPQFLNVLKGDMSIIGPRPKLPEEIDLYEDNKNELLSVLPGITGYWQVYRKTAYSDESMRNMDLFYIRNRSIVIDFKILTMTVVYLFSGKNY
jgi:lipopolysaccharide/colanic/teichoic acid biosynthesis glycosyltransferase